MIRSREGAEEIRDKVSMAMRRPTGIIQDRVIALPRIVDQDIHLCLLMTVLDHFDVVNIDAVIKLPAVANVEPIPGS